MTDPSGVQNDLVACSTGEAKAPPGVLADEELARPSGRPGHCRDRLRQDDGLADQLLGDPGCHAAGESRAARSRSQHDHISLELADGRRDASHRAASGSDLPHRHTLTDLHAARNAAV